MATEKSTTGAPTPAEAQKTVDKGVAPAVSPTEATNVKVSVQAGTVPPSMQAPGPNPPHPSSEAPDKSADTPEVADARARAEGADDEPERRAATNIPAPIGDKVQTIVKKIFFDAEGRTVKPGATYWYQPLKGQVPPFDIMEPVDKTVASKWRRAFEEARQDRIERQERQRRARDNFARALDEMGS